MNRFCWLIFSFFFLNSIEAQTREDLLIELVPSPALIKPDCANYPAHCAAWSGQHDLLKSMIQNGLDVDTLDNKGRSPIFYATRVGANLTLELLLEQHAKLNSADNEFLSPLHYAVILANTFAVTKLIDAGASINQRSPPSFAPLYFATKNADLPMVKLLVEAGADLNACASNNDCPTVYSLSIWQSTIGVMEYLRAKGATLFRTGERDSSALTVAVSNFPTSLPAAERLLVLGEEIDKNQGAALRYSLEKSSPEKVCWLLNHSARLDISLPNGRIIVEKYYRAIELPEIAACVAKYLPAPYLNKKLNGVETFAHHAARKLFVDATKNLGVRGSDFNMVDSAGKAILKVAFEGDWYGELGTKRLETIDVLLEFGARPELIPELVEEFLANLPERHPNLASRVLKKLFDNGGFFPPLIKGRPSWSYAIDVLARAMSIEQFAEIYPFFLSRSNINGDSESQNAFTAFLRIQWRGRRSNIGPEAVALFQRALGLGLDANALTYNGQPLGSHFLCEDLTENLACQQLWDIYLSTGADVGVQDSDGRNLLHLMLAFDKKSPKLIKKLVLNGCDINAVDRYDRTPLTYYLRHFYHDVKWFISLGANPFHIEQKSGRNLIHVAADLGNIQSIAALVEAGVDRNALDFNGDTPAKIAETKQHLLAARYLEDPERARFEQIDQIPRDNHFERKIPVEHKYFLAIIGDSNNSWILDDSGDFWRLDRDGKARWHRKGVLPMLGGSHSGHRGVTNQNSFWYLGQDKASQIYLVEVNEFGFMSKSPIKLGESAALEVQGKSQLLSDGRLVFHYPEKLGLIAADGTLSWVSEVPVEQNWTLFATYFDTQNQTFRLAYDKSDHRTGCNPSDAPEKIKVVNIHLSGSRLPDNTLNIPDSKSCIEGRYSYFHPLAGLLVYTQHDNDVPTWKALDPTDLSQKWTVRRSLGENFNKISYHNQQWILPRGLSPSLKFKSLTHDASTIKWEIDFKDRYQPNEVFWLETADLNHIYFWGADSKAEVLRITKLDNDGKIVWARNSF